MAGGSKSLPLKLIGYANALIVVLAAIYLLYELFRGESPPWDGVWFFFYPLVALMVLRYFIEKRASKEDGNSGEK